MVNVYDYDELLDSVEKEIEDLRKKYPEQEDFIIRIRSALRYFQLAMNLTMAKAEATNMMLREHLKTQEGKG